MIKIIQFIKKYYFYLIALILGVAVFNYQNIVDSIFAIPDNFNSGHVFYRYSTLNNDVWEILTTKTGVMLKDVFKFFSEFDYVGFLNKLIINTFEFLINFVNYGLNVLIYLYLFAYIFISKETDNPKYTKMALWFISYMKLLSLIKLIIIKFIKHLQNNKKHILLSFMLYLLLQSFLIKALSEIAIFLYYYFMSSVNLDLHMTIFYVFKAIILFVYLEIPKWIIILGSIYFMWKFALNRADHKLERNHDQIKMFAKHDLPYVTVIDGVPDSGKTRLTVNLALATEENYIDEIDDTIHGIEISNPQVNFGEIEKNKYKHIQEFPEHYEYCKYRDRKTSFIMSVPFAVNDPYADDYSHILSYDYIRTSKQNDVLPFEKYNILIFSELDKEYNSHYSKDDVGEDGVHIFFGVSSHFMERKGKIFADYQIKTQVPLNIRANAEKFLHIMEYKHKFPFLISIFMIPFNILYGWIDNIIKNYESYVLKLHKFSKRNSKRIRKRYDYTFIYSVLRYSIYYVERILMFFQKYLYLKFIIRIRDIEDTDIGKAKVYVNNFDEYYKGNRLYETAFLSGSYKEHKNKKHIDWDSLPKWNGLNPSIDQLKQTKSRFIDKAYNILNNTEKLGDEKHDKDKTSVSENEFKF